MELVVLAAGNGKRFGGLKQFEEIDNQGNFLIDYTIYDAIRFGVKKVIFVIQKQNFYFFNETIKKRWKNKVEIRVVFQKFQLGTCDALLQAKREVSDSFIVVNADDLYGSKCFKIAKKFLDNSKVDNNEFAMISFKAKNTLQSNKEFKRGVCCLGKNALLQKIQECVIIKDAQGKIVANVVESDKNFQIKKNHLISVNFFIFKKSIFNLIKKNYISQQSLFNKNKLEKHELFLPDAISNLISSNLITVKVLKSNNKLKGMTYFEDKYIVEKQLRFLRLLKIYPKILQK